MPITQSYADPSMADLSASLSRSALSARRRVMNIAS